MKKILLLILCAASALGLSAQLCKWSRTFRYAEYNKNLTKAPDAVFMGNSITDFWYRDVPEFFEENNYAGRGISGQTTDHMLVRFRQDVINLHPKAVVILAGINDIAENNGPVTDEYILNNIISMCELAAANGITPVLCSICPSDYFKWRKELKPAERVVRVNGLIKEYADKMNYEYVDYHSVMSDENGAMKPGLSKDHCHPTVEGYSLMIPEVQKALGKVLGK